MIDPIALPKHVGVVFNPKSGHVSRNLKTLRRLALQIPHSMVIEATNPTEIAEALDTFNLGVNDLLVVIGGDGSLQAALTASLRRSMNSTPLILALPAGTTNMSAVDLGMTMTPASTLEALISWLIGTSPAPSVSTRSILQISDAGSSLPQFGLFFGAGAIIDGVRYFHSEVRPKNIRGALGPAFTFMRMLLSLFRRNEQDVNLATRAGLQLQHQYLYSPWLLILATTLDKLLLKSTPYWGLERAPMHFTAIAHHAPRLLSSLPFLLRGKSNAAMQESRAYVSQNLTHAAIHDLNEYLLDGELFATRSPLCLSADVSARFILFDAEPNNA
ncbi:acylglycerol kinase family protein [Pseudomonas sp. SDO5532_S415]